MKNNCKHAANLILPNGRTINMKIADAIPLRAALKEAAQHLRKTANTLDDFVFEYNLASSEEL